MTWGVIDDEAVAEASSMIGVPLRRSRMQWVEEASRDAIRHFAWGIGDDNPLWVDSSYATDTHWKSIIAPPCFLYAVDYTVVAPKLPGVQWIYAGTDWTWFDAVRLGDKFEVTAALTEQNEKQGKTFGRWLLQTGRIDYRTTDGNLVGVALGHCARTPRAKPASVQIDASDKGTPASGPYKYSADEVQTIEDQVLAEKRRGSENLYWEDVSVGDLVPSVVKGPLSIVDIVAWYSATQGAQPYGGVHGDALRYRERHADYHLNAETGVKDSAGRGHLEAQTGRDVGMGGAYDVGPQRISWAGHMLANWLGDEGFLHKLNVEVRKPNLVGDTTWWHGEVAAKWQVGSANLVSILVVAKNQRGERTAWGHAVALLPSRTGGPLELPLTQEFEAPEVQQEA